MYCRDPIAILKRLTRELFEKNVALESRLTDIEERLGISREVEGPAANASRVATSGHTSSHPGGLLRSLGGRLVLGGGFLWGDNDEEGLDSVMQAGVKLGTTMTLQARGQFRDSKDFILADIAVDNDSEHPFSLQKVLYSCQILPKLRCMFAPFGARGNDVTYTLNPFAGRGLTAATSEGNPLLHNRGSGSVLAAAIDLPWVWLTGAYFGKDMDDDSEEGSSSAFVQVLVAPVNELSLGVTLTETPDNSSRLWRYGDMVLGSLLKSHTPTHSESLDSDMEIGGSFALSLGNYALHGWATTQYGNISDMLNGSIDSWNIALGEKQTTASSARLIVSAGKTPMSSTSSNTSDIAPNTFELSTEFDLGNGLSCQPGLLGIRDGSSWTLLAGAKTHWNF